MPPPAPVISARFPVSRKRERRSFVAIFLSIHQIPQLPAHGPHPQEIPIREIKQHLRRKSCSKALLREIESQANRFQFAARLPCASSRPRSPPKPTRSRRSPPIAR